MPDDLSYSETADRVARQDLDSSVWAKSGGRCWYCGDQLLPVEAWKRRHAEYYQRMELRRGRASVSMDYKGLMVIDHFHSRRMGGTDDLSNLVPACWACNCAKGKRGIEDFRWTVFYRKQGIPAFTKDQRKWLVAQGFSFAAVAAVRFWFEQEGLKP